MKIKAKTIKDIKHILNLLCIAGADDYHMGSYQYKLLTKYGDLLISIHDGWIASVFEHPSIGAIGTSCDDYNGKWNHFTDTGAINFIHKVQEIALTF